MASSSTIRSAFTSMITAPEVCHGTTRVASAWRSRCSARGPCTLNRSISSLLVCAATSETTLVGDRLGHRVCYPVRGVEPPEEFSCRHGISHRVRRGQRSAHIPWKGGVVRVECCHSPAGHRVAVDYWFSVRSSPSSVQTRQVCSRASNLTP